MTVGMVPDGYMTVTAPPSSQLRCIPLGNGFQTEVLVESDCQRRVRNVGSRRQTPCTGCHRMLKAAAHSQSGCVVGLGPHNSDPGISAQLDCQEPDGIQIRLSLNQLVKESIAPMKCSMVEVIHRPIAASRHGLTARSHVMLTSQHAATC